MDCVDAIFAPCKFSVIPFIILDMAQKQPVKKTAASAKSAPAKKTSRPSASASKSEVKNVSTPATPAAPIKVKKSYVILGAVLVLVAAFLYFFRGLFVAAVVNGQPISRWAIVKEAEKQSGKHALSNLVRNTVIEQEAQKQNVTVSEQEIDQEVKKVEDSLSKQGQKLDQVLSLQGMTRQDLRKLIRLDKLVGKLVGKDIKVTDQEVADYIEKNKELLPQNQDENSLKATVREQIKQQKLNDKVRTWLAEVQKNAKILYFVQY